jgi:O-antigen ligase
MIPSRLARTLQEGSLYLLLLLLPFSKAAIEILFPILLLSWLAERCDPRTRADTLWARPGLRPLLLVLGGYLAVCALSIAVSTAPRLSLRGFFSKWLEYLLFFVVSVDIGSRRGVATRSAVVVAVSSVLVVVEAVTQELSGKGLFLGHELLMYGRATGPYENPIDLATYVMVVIPLLLAFSGGCRPWPRAAVWGLAVLLLLVFARTDALGAWLALCFGAMVVMVRHAGFRRYSLLVLAGLLLAGWLSPQGRSHLAQVVSSAGNGLNDRWIMWQAAIGMIRDRPLLGHGVNTFMDNYLLYRVGGEIWPRYAHNCYLQVAAETGLVGFGFFVSLLGVLFVRLLGRLRDRLSGDRLVLSGLVVGLVAFAFQAGIDTNFYALRQAVLFWVLAGFALGLSERIQAPVSPS